MVQEDTTSDGGQRGVSWSGWCRAFNKRGGRGQEAWRRVFSMFGVWCSTSWHFAVATSGYASDSEVIRESPRVLKAREQAMEKWLSEEILPAYQKLKDDPVSSMSVEQPRTALAKHRK